jgi:hypothetical protein
MQHPRLFLPVMVLSILAFFLMSAGLATAQTQPAATQAAQNAADFNQILNDPAFAVRTLKIAETSPVWSNNPCPSARFMPSPHVTIYANPTFNAQNQPVYGAWKVQFTVNGCDRTMVLNVLTEVENTGQITGAALVPGETELSPDLADTAEKAVLKASYPPPIDCTSAFITDTKFVGFDGAPTPGFTAPWKELWTIDECKSLKAVTLHIAPGKDGPTISVNPSETEFLN